MKKKAIFIVLFIILAVTLNNIYGNPVSEKLAQSSVEKYLEENHPEYEIKRQWYDWINGNYCAEVWIPGSVDCIFDMTISHSGNIKHSNYKYTVANNANTFLRANNIYMDMCESVIDKFTHESKVPEGMANDGSFGVADLFDIDVESYMYPPFENDKEYTKEDIDSLASVYGSVSIYLKKLPRNEITVENLADTILQVKNEFDSDNVKFRQITVVLQGYESQIRWHNIPYEIINEQDILQLTKENSTFENY